MSLFIREGKIKSTLILMGFSLSLLYVVFFFVGYLLCADLVAAMVPEDTGSLLQVWGPPSLICIAVALLCSLPLLFAKNKLVIPVAFTFLALYAALIVTVGTAGYAGEVREMLLQLMALYLVLPALWGNLVGWGGYLLLSRRKKKLRAVACS